MTSDETRARSEAVADWELERFRLGELPEEEMRRVRRQVASDATLRLRIDALERSSETILERDPPPEFAAGVRERLAQVPVPVPQRPPARTMPYAWAGAAAAVVAAIAALTLLPGGQPGSIPVPIPNEDVTQVKGLQPRLEIFRQTPAGVESLEDGSPARLDDVIQIAYQAGGLRYGVIVSVDGRGLVTVHLPAKGDNAAELGSGKVALADAYRLDDAPRFERFYFVTSNEPFAVSRVVEALQIARRGSRSSTRIALPPAMQQASIELKKVP